MISYELAKKLKDTEFPNNHSDGDECHVYECFQEPDGSNMHCPTLSELIEACGDKFDSLMRLTGGGWVASPAIGVEAKKGNGDSPEEAVIGLWINLKQNEVL